MQDKSDVNKNLQYWNKMAEEKGDACVATIPDTYLKLLELESIYKYIKDGTIVLDVGCGNGFTCFELANRFDIKLKGIDFSEEMINVAKVNAKTKDITFEVCSAMQLNEPDNFYDIVLSERLIVNLPDWDTRKKGMTEICRVLKKGGILILAEAFIEPTINVDILRKIFGLTMLEDKWSKCYLSEEELLSWIKETNLYELVDIDNYSSAYYFLTRVVSPAIGKLDDRRTGYLDTINRVAFMLPSEGNYGIQKTYVLRKK